MTGRHSASGRGQQPVPAPANEPDCSSRRPNVPGAWVGRRQRRDGTEAGADEAALGGLAAGRQLALELGQQLVGEVAVVAGVVGVLDQPLAGCTKATTVGGITPPWMRLSTTVDAAA